MLTLRQKTDYALISLAYLAGREGRLASARQIASAADLPLPLLMQILKTLHQHGILRSTRGVKGGYCLAPKAETLSLLALIRIVDGEQDANPEQRRSAPDANPQTAACGFASQSVTEAGPLLAMHRKLLQFLEEVKVFDVIRPGRRIDVPVEALFIHEGTRRTRRGRSKSFSNRFNQLACTRHLIAGAYSGRINLLVFHS